MRVGQIAMEGTKRSPAEGSNRKKTVNNIKKDGFVLGGKGQ